MQSNLAGRVQVPKFSGLAACHDIPLPLPLSCHLKRHPWPAPGILTLDSSMHEIASGHRSTSRPIRSTSSRSSQSAAAAGAPQAGGLTASSPLTSTPPARGPNGSADLTRRPSLAPPTPPSSATFNLPGTSRGVLDKKGPNDILYFAFGSNMNPKVLSGRRGVIPKASSPGLLRDHNLSFRLMGLPFLEPCFATIERLLLLPLLLSCRSSVSGLGEGQGSHPEVHGVVHVITKKEWERVKQSEGVVSHSDSYGYQEVLLPCHLYDRGSTSPSGAGVRGASSGEEEEEDAGGSGKGEVEVMVVTLQATTRSLIRGREADRWRMTSLQGDRSSTTSSGGSGSARSGVDETGGGGEGGQDSPRGRRGRPPTGQTPPPPPPSRPLRPSARYLGLIREGARHHGLERSYQTWLGSLEAYDPTTRGGTSPGAAVSGGGGKVKRLWSGGPLAGAMAAAALVLPVIALEGVLGGGTSADERVRGAAIARLSEHVWKVEDRLSDLFGPGR